jgi:hypothetical protein
VDSEPDTVSIEANTPPVASAGDDQIVETGATVTLDGSGSTDADGDELSYRWRLTTVPEGSTLELTGVETDALTGAETANPSFVADRAGTYEVELVVNDGTVDSEPDRVSVTGATISDTIPQFPNTFYGEVIASDGQPAQVGMVITAVVGKGVPGSEKRYSITITEPGKYGAPNGLKLKVGGDLQGAIANGSTIEFFLSVDSLPDVLEGFESLAEVPFFDDQNPHNQQLNLVASFNGDSSEQSES